MPRGKARSGQFVIELYFPGGGSYKVRSNEDHAPDAWSRARPAAGDAPPNGLMPTEKQGSAVVVDPVQFVHRALTGRLRGDFQSARTRAMSAGEVGVVTLQFRLECRFATPNVAIAVGRVDWITWLGIAGEAKFDFADFAL